MAATLEELSRRLASIAGDYQEAKREDLAGELYEAERALSGAVRRVNRVASARGA